MACIEIIIRMHTGLGTSAVPYAVIQNKKSIRAVNQPDHGTLAMHLDPLATEMFPVCLPH
jgi:hypothetical protein